MNLHLTKREREYLAVIDAELAAAGVAGRAVTRTSKGHLFVNFRLDDKPARLMFSGSDDPKAWLRIRSQARAAVRQSAEAR